MRLWRKAADADHHIIPLVPSRKCIPDEASFNDNPETAELERLYQQALDAMDDADAGLEVATGAFPDIATAAEIGGPLEESESPHPLPKAAVSDLVPPAAAAGSAPRLIPRQILEAALFVGGASLTSKKLASLLRAEFDSEFIEHAIDELNSTYRAQERPYEIRLGEGGYRLTLRSSFESVRNRVFGMGPREVRLNQEALEVLALVAYQQPVSREEIEETRQSPAGTVLRQLLRREMIAIERSAGSAEKVAYRTTDRFLDAFGLASLEELPQAEELNFK